MFQCRISPWPKTVEKRVFCTGVTDGRTNGRTDRPSYRDAFLTDASKKRREFISSSHSIIQSMNSALILFSFQVFLASWLRWFPNAIFSKRLGNHQKTSRTRPRSFLMIFILACDRDSFFWASCFDPDLFIWSLSMLVTLIHFFNPYLMLWPRSFLMILNRHIF